MAAAAGAALAGLVVVVVVVVAAALCSSTAAAAAELGAGRIAAAGARRPVVPAVYVFGDSLVDVGNNNFLPPPAPKSVAPEGVDLPPWVLRRVGRFTNGYNLADIIAQYVGFKMSPPAYLSLTPLSSLDLLGGRGGANYASGGSGILNITGNGTITLREQVQLFASTKAAILRAGLVGRERLDGLLARSLFVVSTGGNDFGAFDGGAIPISQAPEFVAGMVADYLKRIKELYELGARRLVLIDVFPVGCLPSQRATTADGSCDAAGNYLSDLFNARLRAELPELAGASAGLAYSVAGLHNVFTDMIADNGHDGLREVETACCGGGRFNGEVACTAAASLCADRDAYVFWDQVHGTQAAYRRAVRAFFYGPTRAAEPMNIDQLLRQTSSSSSTATATSF